MIGGIFKGFASMALMRILSRILQFFLRVYLIRKVLSPEILAQMIALDLIVTSSLYITKQCFKKSYPQVQSNSKQQNIYSSMNLMSIGVLVTFVSSIIVIFLQWNHKIQVKYVNESIIVYGICSLLEALKEKYSVQFVLNYQYERLGVIEFASYLPKTLMLFIAAKMGLFEIYGILMFALGHLLFYAMSLILTFLWCRNRVLLLRSIQGQNDKGEKQTVYLDSKTKKILRELSYMSIVKLFLQQFQKIVLVFNNQVEDSSIYSIVSNLGSIIVRFVFAPLEQISYNYFARGNQDQSKKSLTSLVKILSIFGIICAFFGFRYGENVLFMLYGQRWVNDHSVLGFQTYMILIWVLGLNGIIDSFVIARGDPEKTVSKLKYFTVVSTLIYFASSFFFMQMGYGASGLFLGNIVGMVARIAINWYLQISRHITIGQFLKKIIPNPLFLGFLFSSIGFSYYIKIKVQNLKHSTDFLIGCLLLLVTLSPILYQYRKEIVNKIKRKFSKKQKST